jgi:hypothetical protein
MKNIGIAIFVILALISIVGAFEHVAGTKESPSIDKPLLAIRDTLCASFFILIAILIKL